MESMNATIRRLTMTFIILLLIISGVAAYVQVGDRAFFNGPALTTSSYAPTVRDCPPYDAPLRGTIYDRNGVPLVWTQADPNASPCGYKRVVSADAVSAGLGPLLGYFSYQYGTAGIEQTYNDYLAGIGAGTPANDLQNKLLHKPRYGNDLYLSIDLRLQEKANADFDSSAVYAHNSSSPCQPAGTSPPGGMVVEDPSNGQILALVSHPTYDPNKISDPKYWQQLNSDPGAPLLDHATQGLYVPGSTFKTVTLAADLDSNPNLDPTAKTYDQQSATHFQPYGYDFQWVDYTQKGEWQNIPNLFPMSLNDGYAYSDNTIYARAALDVGKQTWLNYIEKFGIAVPGDNVSPVTFDAPYSQSQAYPATTNGKPTNFDPNLLAASGFGQGDLLITPLTMAEVTSAVANGGTVFDPHAVKAIVPHVDNDNSGNSAPTNLALPSGLPDCGAFSGLPCNVPAQTYGTAFSSDTATKVRAAMWAVTSYGTGVLYRNGTALADQPIKIGGKTGTGENGSGGIATTWWLAIAQDDQAPGGGPAQVAFAMEKDKSGEGACQVYVSYDTFEAAREYNYLKT